MGFRIGTKVRTYLAALLTTSILFAGYPAPVLGTTEVSELSIQQAIDLALDNDPGIRTSDLAVRELEILRDKAAEAVEYIPTGGLVYPATQTLISQYRQAEINLEAARKTQKTQQDLTAKNVIAAYISSLKNKNTLDYAKLKLSKLQKQLAISKVSRELGLVSAYDWETIENGLSQAEAGVKAAEANYQSSILSLTELIGVSNDSNFQLSSKPQLKEVEKDLLETELSRATNDSVLVLRAQKELEIEEFNQNLILIENGSVKSSEQRNIDLSQAQASYDQAKRDARTSVESMYFGIDALERQIQTAELVYVQAEKALNDAQIRYRVGLIPLISSTGTQDLMTAQVELEKAKSDLENLRADLAKLKADFYYVTGRTVYESADWSNGSGSSIDLQTVNYKPQTGNRISFTVGASTYKNGDDIITLDSPAYIKSGRTYLPVRALGESLGAVVSWDEETRTVTLTRVEDRVELVIGDYNIKINGSYTTMEVVPEIAGGRTMLPARYVTEAFGALITWNEKSQEVVIFR